MMDVAMKWIYNQVRGMEAGQKPCLCFRGRKHMLAVAAGHPVRVLKRPAVEYARARDVMQPSDGAIYPIARAVEQFEALGVRDGITAAAERLLERARSLAPVSEEDEDDITDEENVSMMTENPAPVDGATNETTTEENDVSKKTKAKAPRAEKKAAKAPKPKAAKAPKPKAAKVEIKKGAPSLREGSVVLRAYEWWKAELLKHDNPKNLDRGARKEICDRMNAKFGIKSGASYYQFYAKNFGLPK